MARTTRTLGCGLVRLGLALACGCGDPETGASGETTDPDDGGSDAAGSEGSTGPSGADTTAGSDGAASTGGGPGVCGDGIVDPGEECDDANTFDTDGCNAQCELVTSDDLPFNEAPFAATHNSYAGGGVGAVRAQLDAGVRFVEFDLHTDSFSSEGYRIGHDAPGDEVMLGSGNPDVERMDAWLQLVADWSDENPGHAPLTVLIDFKDRPSGQSYADGNLANFNDMVDATLGRDRLFTPGALAALDGQWPTVAELSDRVIVVLSGDEAAQLDYRRDRGDDPAIAINTLGQVVEVHVSEATGSEMWLWTGQVQRDGTIGWRRHSRYDTGNQPAVAINDDGVIVEVHEDPDFGDNKLWYRVGQLDGDLEVQWATEGGQAFPGDDSGVLPSIAFETPDGSSVREVHQSPSSAQHWYWHGASIDTTAGSIPWARPDGDGTTADDLYPTDVAQHDGTEYSITAGDVGPFTQTLTVHGETTHRVRYEQLAFGSATVLTGQALVDDGLVFFGDNAGTALGVAFIEGKNAEGMVTRLWKFDDPTIDVGPLNFPATDTPFEDWYTQYCDIRACAE